MWVSQEIGRTLCFVTACAHQSMVSTALLIDTSRLLLSPDLTGHVWLTKSYLACSARQPNYPSFEKENIISVSVCLLCTHTNTHAETHGWFGTAVLPATSSLSFPPLSPWRQASRAGWLQTVVNQHRLKREGERGGGGGGGGVSLCLNMTKRTLWALCYLGPDSEVIKEPDHSCIQMWKGDRNILIKVPIFEARVVFGVDSSIHMARVTASFCACSRTECSSALHTILFIHP